MGMGGDVSFYHGFELLSDYGGKYIAGRNSVFVGLSSIGTILVEFLGFGILPSFWQLVFMVTLIVGVIGLKLLNEQVER